MHFDTRSTSIERQQVSTCISTNHLGIHVTMSLQTVKGKPMISSHKEDFSDDVLIRKCLSFVITT